jgi:hypothetical protein
MLSTLCPTGGINAVSFNEDNGFVLEGFSVYLLIRLLLDTDRRLNYSVQRLMTKVIFDGLMR